MKSERIHYRIRGEIIAWVRRVAAKRRTTVSEVAREIMYAAFDKRHAK